MTSSMLRGGKAGAFWTGSQVKFDFQTREAGGATGLGPAGAAGQRSGGTDQGRGGTGKRSKTQEPEEDKGQGCRAQLTYEQIEHGHVE